MASANDRGSSPFDDDPDFVEKTTTKRKPVIKDSAKKKRALS